MKLWKGFVAALGMLAMILDGQTALAGAVQGIDLCLKTVIPSLFPFFLLTNLMTSSLSGTNSHIFRILSKLCKTPSGTGSILIASFLGGYPVGAQLVTSAYTSGSLSKAEASRMLAFCNNAGPAFLFGMVSSAFPTKWYVATLWGIHLFSAILVSAVLPGGSTDSMASASSRGLSFSEALQLSLRTMATVCGWVTLFRILIAFLNRWILWIFPLEVRVFMTGFLELSNGCWELLTIDSISTRFLICSAMLAFGGLCVTMQTASVCGKLPLRSYLCGKVLQTFFSILLSLSFLKRVWLFCFTTLMTTLLILGKIQKSSSNRGRICV